MQLFLIPITLFILTCSPTYSHNFTRTTTSLIPKPKRALNDQIQNGADSKPVMVFLDNISSQTQNVPSTNRNFYPSSKPLALVSLQQPIQVFEQDSPKQVAAQQVLYEFQQTPTNAESNVHVKQLFQPMDITESPTTLVNSNPSLIQNSNNPQSSATVAQTQPNFVQNQPNFGQNQPSFAQQQQSFGQNQHSFGQPHQSAHNSVLNASPNQFIATSETIVSPVSHNSFTNHAQNYAHVSHPLYNIQPHHVQAHHYVPGKYLYVNGKIVYQPNSPNPTNHHNHQGAHHNNLGLHQNGFLTHQVGTGAANNNHLNLMLNGNQHKVPLNSFNNRGTPPQALGTVTNVGLRQKMVPPQNTPPITYHSFRPPQKSQLQQITKPSNTPVKPVEENTEEEEEEPENAGTEEDEDVEENDEEEEKQDRSNKYEDDDEDHGHFGKYYFDEDEEDHKPEEEDNDEDSSRDSSKHHISKKKPKKSKSNYSKSDGYKYAEGFRTSYKSATPKKGSKKKGKKPQTLYKTVKYLKKEGKPADAQGRYSENTPVTHKQRIIKEKWYMTRSTDD